MARHREILRLTLLGWSSNRIAAAMDITPAGIRAVLRSPLMQAELERMQEEADRLTVNTPLRAQVEAELRGSTIEAMRLNRRIMNDSSVDTKVRSGIAKHFMDRTLFEVDQDEGKQSSYREILRRLDTLDRQLGQGTWLITGASETESSATPDASPPSDEPGNTSNEKDLTEVIKQRLGFIPTT